MKQKPTVSSAQASALSIDFILQRVWVLGLILLFILAFWYLMMLNSLATKGFLLEEMKANRLSLQKNLEDLDIELAIPTSLYALESYDLVQQLADEKNRMFFYVDPKDQFVMNVKFK